MMLAACANDVDTVGSDGTRGSGGLIAFNPGVAPITRSDKTGADAATALGNKFYVYAIKNEDETGVGTLTSDNLVFKNYKVEYKSGSENTSTTNTTGWEYVGKTLTKTESERITDNIGTDAQLIKYWDNSAKDYTFYAFAVSGNSGNSDDITDGLLTVKKTNDKADVHRNGYTMTVDANADPATIYIADRKHIDAVTGDYGKDVKFSFHNAMAKIRVAMYETIPGYTVTLKAFRVADENAPAFGNMTTEETKKFAANLVNNKSGRAGTMTVEYEEVEPNTPTVKFDPTDKSDNILTLGSNLKANTELGTSTTDAVYDDSNKEYTTVYPMEGNANNLKLKVDFTLKAKTGETIEVTNATAEVPATYLRWRPGCAYTYIFKISDQTNATIGSLTGLHPITFDAVAITDGTGHEEVISTTGNGTPNIVTMGYDAATDKIVVGEDDYSEGNTLYAVFVKDDNVVNVTSTTDATKLYVVTTDDNAYPITESAVEEYLADYATDATLVDQHVTAYEQTLNDDNYVTEVPMGNGSTDKRSLNAMTWTAGKHVYAVAYTYTTTTSGTTTKSTIYKIVGVDGYKGRTSGTLALSTSVVTNAGAAIKPTLNVDGVTAPNSEVSYALDYAGNYGAAVPTGVTVTSNKSDDVTIKVPASTTPTGSGKYTVIATYNRRTYKASFTVEQ